MIKNRLIKLFFLLMAIFIAFLLWLVFTSSFSPQKNSVKTGEIIEIKSKPAPKDTISEIITEIDVDKALRYAETLLGKPYVYARADPNVGFDCSGFVSHVFGRFGMKLPHSSSLYMNIGKTISLSEAKRGDILVFTGVTHFDNKTRAGHLGIVYQAGDTIKFIHASSGKAMGVTITPLSGNYLKRFIKVIRVLPQNGE